MIIRNARKSIRKKKAAAKKKTATRKRRSSARKKTVKGAKIRPVIIKVGKTCRRPKRSRTFKKAVRINPKRRRRTRRNPKLNIKSLLSQQNFVTLGAIAGGIVAWPYIKGMALRNIEDKEALARTEKFIGVVPVAVGLLMLTMAKKAVYRNIGMGMGAIGLYDLLSTNVSSLHLVPTQSASVSDLGASYPARLGATYATPVEALTTVNYGRPSSVSRHYLQVSGDGENPYADIQW